MERTLTCTTFPMSYVLLPAYLSEVQNYVYILLYIHNKVSYTLTHLSLSLFVGSSTQLDKWEQVSDYRVHTIIHTTGENKARQANSPTQ